MGGVTNVYLITGFLGSGKTTFLNRIMKSFPPNRKLMILMNEFGEVGVDGTLVEGEDVDMMEISKGSIFCVCVKTDFIKGLNEIARTVQPDVLLIESTGVANPSDLKRDLGLPFFKERFNLAEQFCLIDAAHFTDEYEIFASVEKQIASSTLFIINKIDLAGPEQVSRVKELVARHNPNPKFYETTYADIPLETFFPAGPESSETGDVVYLSDDELETAIDELLDDPNREITPPDRLLSAVYLWKGGGMDDFRTLLDQLPEKIIRAKGFLEGDGETWLFSLVMGQRELGRAKLAPERQEILNRLVFIAPPETMEEMEALSARFPVLTQESVLDPMAGQG